MWEIIKFILLVYAAGGVIGIIIALARSDSDYRRYSDDWVFPFKDDGQVEQFEDIDFIDWLDD